MGDSFNKPNVVIPLAASYDTRNITSRTSMQAGVDQRKINFQYDLIRNAVTGNSTLELVKRPGILAGVQTSWTTGSTPTEYALTNINNFPWVLSKESNTSYVGDGSTVTALLNNSAFTPYSIDLTTISNTPTVYAQLRETTVTNAQRVFYASAIGAWTEITDSDFTALGHRGKMEPLDGYMFTIDYLGRIFNSDLNSLANWTAGNFIKKQVDSDYTLGLAKFKTQLLAFGSATVEAFYNAGNPSGSPLSRVTGGVSKIGMGSIGEPGAYGVGKTSYYCIIGERMYFVGRNAGGNESQSLFSYNGQSFEKISTPPLDRIMATGNPSDIYSITAFGYMGRTAVAIQMTNPTVTAQKWLMFFPELNEWFEWTSDVFSPVSANGYFLAAGNASGSRPLYTFGFPLSAGPSNTWTDAGTAYTASVQFKIPKKANNRDFMHWCALDADTTTSASNVTVEFSDNDYQSFSTGRTIDLNTQEKRLNRCGSYKTPRVVRLSHSANAEFRARNFLARVE